MASAPQLREACEDLVGLLERSQVALDQVANKLEQEFATRFGPNEVNPLALSQRIRKLERELPALKEQCQAVMSSKQELLDAARKLMVSNHDQLQGLSSRSGFAPPSDRGAYAAFSRVTAEWEAQTGAAAGALHPQYRPADLNMALVRSALDK